MGVLLLLLLLCQAEARADVIIESRSGAVLGALTILKEDYFPGMKSNRCGAMGVWVQQQVGAERVGEACVWGGAGCTVHDSACVLFYLLLSFCLSPRHGTNGMRAAFCSWLSILRT
jgi:hypothetical protein